MAERISTTGTSMAAAVVPGAGAATHRSRRNRWGNPVGYLFIGPGVLLYLIFSVYPILRGIVMSFQNYRFLRPASRNPFNSFNGLDNWIEMWNDPMFWHSLRVAGTFTLGALPADILLGLACAVLISSIPNSRFETATRVIAYLPVILPISVAML